MYDECRIPGLKTTCVPSPKSMPVSKQRSSSRVSGRRVPRCLSELLRNEPGEGWLISTILDEVSAGALHNRIEPTESNAIITKTTLKTGERVARARRGLGRNDAF